MTYRWAVPYLALGVSLAACQPVAPSSDVFAPARDRAPAAPAAAPAGAPSAAATPVEGGFDFEAEDRPADEGAKPVGELSPTDIYQGLGLGDAVPAVAPEAAPEPVAAPVAPPAPAWTGAAAPVNWGVRLVSTVPDAQPPRAILGMADGKEHVVTPGTLLPEARIVVLAIGRDLVQVAEVTPEGDHARVATYLLQALYPGERAQR